MGAGCCTLTILRDVMLFRARFRSFASCLRCMSCCALRISSSIQRIRKKDGSLYDSAHERSETVNSSRRLSAGAGRHPSYAARMCAGMLSFVKRLLVFVRPEASGAGAACSWSGVVRTLSWRSWLARRASAAGIMSRTSAHRRSSLSVRALTSPTSRSSFSKTSAEFVTKDASSRKAQASCTSATPCAISTVEGRVHRFCNTTVGSGTFALRSIL